MKKMTVANAAKCIKSTVAMLARSQGFYGRVYEDCESGDRWEEIARAALDAGVNPADSVDLVLWFEA